MTLCRLLPRQNVRKGRKVQGQSSIPVSPCSDDAISRTALQTVPSGQTKCVGVRAQMVDMKCGAGVCIRRTSTPSQARSYRSVCACYVCLDRAFACCLRRHACTHELVLLQQHTRVCTCKKVRMPLKCVRATARNVCVDAWMQRRASVLHAEL
eukprot:6196059-Pleurochrysis_carterae.AAC.2